MNLKQIISATASSVLQIFAFIFSWNTAVSIAIDLGRRQHGGVAFGITVHYGTIILAIIIFTTSFLAISKVRKNIKFGVSTILSVIWLWFFVFPTLEDYPWRGTTFGILGIITIFTGFGILLLINKKISEPVE